MLIAEIKIMLTQIKKGSEDNHAIAGKINNLGGTK